MAGKRDAAKVKQLETLSMERRQLIGQAILDGLLTPGEATILPLASDPDYDQGQGGYTQKGGDHNQGGGDYNQSQALNPQDILISVIRDRGGFSR